MTEPKRLYRKTDEAVLAGVCAGLGAYIGLDKAVVRVLWALLTIFSFLIGGILAYVIFWALVPPEPKGPPTQVVP